MLQQGARYTNLDEVLLAKLSLDEVLQLGVSMCGCEIRELALLRLVCENLLACCLRLHLQSDTVEDFRFYYKSRSEAGLK